MGISIKTAGGVVIGGVVGFYLVNKVINLTSRAINDATEASKWKAYYKHGDGQMIPPGYVEMNVPNNPGREYVHPDVAAEREREEKKDEKKAERKNPLDSGMICESIERIAKAYFKAKGYDLDLAKDNTKDYKNDPSVYEDYKVEAVPAVTVENPEEANDIPDEDPKEKFARMWKEASEKKDDETEDTEE